MENARTSLLEAFAELRDPRGRECEHKLEELLLGAICAAISGAESWTAVSEWGQLKLDWLRRHLPFANGIASHDTFGRIFALLSASQFESCFMRSIAQLCPGLEIWLSTAKATRSRRELVDALDIQGAVITLDAMGCQHDIAARITQSGADYVLGVKDNQPGLAEAIRLWFKSANAGTLDRPFWDDIQVEKNHGRIETRRCVVTNDAGWLQEQGQHWASLQSLVMVESTREIIAGTDISTCQTERRYFISSLPAKATLLGTTVRAHWALKTAGTAGRGIPGSRLPYSLRRCGAKFRHPAPHRPQHTQTRYQNETRDRQ